MEAPRDDCGRTPPGAYRHLIEHIQDAVVRFELVDGAPVVRDANAAFLECFGFDREAVLDESLNAVIVPDWRLEEACRLDARTAAGEVNYRRVQRETATGLREFLYRGIPVADDSLPTDGFAVYTDLTDVTRTERRLAVLNRVLRHNLRNRANVIAGQTARLLDALDGDEAANVRMAATVERAATDLTTLAEEASEIASVLDGSLAAGASIDCVPIVQQVVTDFAARAPAADIATDLPDSMPVAADGHLQVALESLVENAIEHNPADRPRVTVRVRPAEAEGWVSLRVEDDGPGIPASEREVVTGEAAITPTRHGTGLGLWLVKWTVERFGGELTFDTSDMDGNSVRLRLPRPNGDGPGTAGDPEKRHG